MYVVPDEVEIRRLFNDACKKLNIDCSEENMQNLVIYEMTDGTRTSTNLEGDEAYFDGGLFCLRFIHLVKSLGCKNLYINVIHEGHKYRDNYKDIYEGMKRHVDVYREYTKHHKVRLRFIGKYDVQINPKDVKGYDFRKSLKELEEMTENNKDLTVHFMINYSTRWASEEGKNFFKTLPDANVIIRHAKGYVNGDMWLHGKLNNNSFVYAQNGSSSINWSDRQLIYLIALSLRSMILNKGTHLSKKYKGTEREEIRRKREIELSLIHKYLYDEKIETKPPKRVIIFSPVGPEIYEF
ncbi:MAG: hypothetical protein ACE5KT_00420 [Methanosarcinales archaeon]